MKRNPRKAYRLGYSLIEMVVLITLVAFTLTSMSMLTHAILRSSQQFVTNAQVRQIHATFLEQVNRDAMEALGDAERTQTENAAFRFMLRSGKRIEYRVSKQIVDREVLGVSGQIEQRDQFRLPPRYRFMSNRGAPSALDWEIQIREELTVQHDGSPQEISTGLRVVIFAAKRDGDSEEARP